MCLNRQIFGISQYLFSTNDIFHAVLIAQSRCPYFRCCALVLIFLYNNSKIDDYDVVELCQDLWCRLACKNLKATNRLITFAPQARNHCVIFLEAQMRSELQICFLATNCWRGDDLKCEYMIDKSQKCLQNELVIVVSKTIIYPKVFKIPVGSE